MLNEDTKNVWPDYINAAELDKALQILNPNGKPFEIRVIGGNTAPHSGYFTDVNTVIRELGKIDLRGRNVYFTLNNLKPGVFDRAQQNRFMQKVNTTSDSDIDGYKWLFIDLDPKRPSGISSSNDELKKAAEMAAQIKQYLKGLGFEDPVEAISGNGYHLLYPIRLANNEENRNLIKSCLETLDAIFSNDDVDVDRTNFNPSRICKMYGTLAQKGSNTKERPHRFAKIVTDKIDNKPTQKMFIEKLAAENPSRQLPVEKSRYYHKAANRPFDLVTWMDKYGLTYRKRETDRSTIYSLDHCPFDKSHTNGDSKIFQFPNGAIAFKCHHNSCSGKTWQDVRKLYEPDAYDSNFYDDELNAGYRQHNRNKGKDEVAYYPDDGQPRFRTARMIDNDKEPDHEYMRSGIVEIDHRMRGFEKKAISVISGLRGSGKSTWIAQIILSAINADNTVIVYSGELNNKKYLNWLIRQAAGKTNIVLSQETEGGYDVVPEVREKIIDWMGDRLWLYDNKFGNNFANLSNAIIQKASEQKADLIIVDNMMALDISMLDQNDFNAQTKFVWSLKRIAEVCNTHVIFVAHPRKTNGFLRLNDISGSGNIANIVDNAFIIHRWNKDFELGYRETFKSSPENDICGGPDKADNVIEIAKERNNGTQDVFIPLYFEPSTKRLLNSPAEYVAYKWDDTPTLPKEIASL